MKRIGVAGLLGIFLLCGKQLLQAQSSDREVRTIRPYEIAVSYNQTTNLIFPFSIKSVDRGSSAVIVQKAKGVNNILQAKATSKDFAPTNLSVVTGDGQFYSFLLEYAEEPPHLNISFAGLSPVQFPEKTGNEFTLERESCQVRGTSSFMNKSSKKEDMRLRLSGILLSPTAMWYKLAIANQSQVDFATDYVRFFLRDKKQARRTARQEIEIFPVFTSHTEKVNGLGKAEWIFGFEPFTVPPNKKLIIQTGEKANGRSLMLPIKSKTVLRARKLPNS